MNRRENDTFNGFNQGGDHFDGAALCAAGDRFRYASLRKGRPYFHIFSPQFLAVPVGALSSPVTDGPPPNECSLSPRIGVLREA